MGSVWLSVQVSVDIGVKRCQQKKEELSCVGVQLDWLDLLALAPLAFTRSDASWLKQGCDRACESCTLALLAACVLFSYSVFILTLSSPLSSLTVAFAGCCSGRHPVLYSMSDSPTRSYFCVLLKSPAASTAPKPAPPLVSVVVLHRCCVFISSFFGLFVSGVIV